MKQRTRGKGEYYGEINKERKGTSKEGMKGK